MSTPAIDLHIQCCHICPITVATNYSTALRYHNTVCSFLDNMDLLFVYGTLKVSQPNHNQLEDKENGKAEFVGKGRTVLQFPLVIRGKWNIPYLLNCPGRGHRVVGEVYCIDRTMLATLDQFEGVPTHFQRLSVAVEMDDGPVLVEATHQGTHHLDKCYIYMKDTFSEEDLALPYLDNFDTNSNVSPALQSERRIQVFFS
uniref:Gamma-glutamylaminecyclotransferase n=1 Tax=Eptatretus burgeri TaxID=7764 RepID=A0A8C4R7Y4_EPTBU